MMRQTWIATIASGLVAVGIWVSVWMSASAQAPTGIPPETTAIPEGVVFSTPVGQCVVSPDELSVGVRGVGVFDLQTGQKRYNLTGETPKWTFSHDSRFLAVPTQGLYDVQTGQLLIESPVFYPEFSPDGRFYVDYNRVYALPSLELLTELNRSGTGIDGYSWLEFLNDNRWIRYLSDGETGVSLMTVDTETWQPVIDMSIYPADAYLAFSHDYTRYAIGGQGVFTYPDGEKLFELPAGAAYFNNDASILVVQNVNESRTTMIYTFIDGETGALITQYSHNTNQAMYRPLFSADFSKIAMPDLAQVGTGADPLYVLTGWRLIDLRTGALIRQWMDDDVGSAWEALGEESQYKYRYADVHGRNVIDRVGVFDVESDTLIKPMDGLHGLQLTAGGSYVVSQAPCTVWRLP